MMLLTCPRCRCLIRYVLSMYQWQCGCRVWHTDEQAVQNAN